MEKRPRQVLRIGQEAELQAKTSSFFAAGTRIRCGPKTDLPWRDFLEEEEEEEGGITSFNWKTFFISCFE